MSLRPELNRWTTETEFCDLVVTFARLHRWLVYHPRPLRRASGKWETPIQGDAGFPDLVMVRPPRILFVELKTMRGALGRAQAAWLEALTACAVAAWPSGDGPAPVEVYVWRPDDWDALEALLRSTPSPTPPPPPTPPPTTERTIL